MAKDDTEVLKSIIAKSTNVTAIANARLELSALQERKASLSAAIKPVLDVPQIVSEPTSPSVTGMVSRSQASNEENVVKNIKKIREDINTLSKESAKSGKILESILKTNEKYFESNKELIDRLLISNNSMLEKLDANMMMASRNAQGAATGNGAVTSAQQSGGYGLADYLAAGALGAGALRLAGGALKLAGKGFKSIFGRRPPDVDAPDVKTKKTGVEAPDVNKKGSKVDPDLEARKELNKIKKKGGKLGLLINLFIAAGASAPWILAYFGGDDETKATMIKDFFGYVPDWLKNLVIEEPDLAFMLGVQAPELAIDAAKTVVPLAKQTSTLVKGTTAAFKGYADIYKDFKPKPPRIFPKGAAGTELGSVNKASQDLWRSAKLGPTVSSITDEVAENAKEIQKLSRMKTGFKTAAKVLKVTKDTIGKAVTKVVGDSLEAIGIKGIPGVGLGLAGLMAGLRLWEGDILGAGGEAAAGIMSIFPGLGTAGSLGVNTLLLARDVYKSLYDVFPEQDDPALRDQRMKEIMDLTQSYVTEQINELTAKGVGVFDSMMPMPNTMGTQTPQPQNDRRGMQSPSVQPVQPVQPYSGEWTPEEAQRSLMGSYASPKTREGIGVLPLPNDLNSQQGIGVLPLPNDLNAQQRLNNINTPAAQTQPNVVINKQGDTINNINNSKNAGGGNAGVSGSPSKAQSPFDYLLYGDVFNWGY